MFPFDSGVSFGHCWLDRQCIMPAKKTKPEEEESNALTCGIIMPIASMDLCDEKHWQEVQQIIKISALGAGFEAQIVSDAKESGVIQKRIIQNIFHADIVVADVSCKNPNVMFELGMRLAFDKPTIIIKDDKTAYSFDTGVIEHLTYPRSLHHFTILEFQQKLEAKIKATHQESQNNPEYTTFLKHFGEFKVSAIEESEISKSDYILKSIESLTRQVSSLSDSPRRTRRSSSSLLNAKGNEEADCRGGALQGIREYLNSEGLEAIDIYRDDDAMSKLTNYVWSTKYGNWCYQHHIDIIPYLEEQLSEML